MVRLLITDICSNLNKYYLCSHSQGKRFRSFLWLWQHKILLQTQTVLSRVKSKSILSCFHSVRPPQSKMTEQKRQNVIKHFFPFSEINQTQFRQRAKHFVCKLDLFNPFAVILSLCNIMDFARQFWTFGRSNMDTFCERTTLEDGGWC